MNFLHLSGESTESFIRKADMAARQCEFWQKAPFLPLFYTIEVGMKNVCGSYDQIMSVSLRDLGLEGKLSTRVLECDEFSVTRTHTAL